MIIRTAAALIAFGLFAGPVSANSFLTVAPPDATPSILALAPDTDTLGPSMIAMGDPAPAVSNENVASVSPEADEPILIRGGIASSGNPSAPVAITPAASGDGSTTHYASKVAEKHALRKAVRDANRAGAASPQPESAAPPPQAKTLTQK